MPYSNQQFSGTVGGPIVPNKLHSSGNYEYERQPLTGQWNTPFPAFNVTVEGKRSVKMGGARADYELSSSMRLMGKYSESRLFEPFVLPATQNLSTHPSAANTNAEKNRDVLGNFTHVMSNRAVNEVRVGYALYGIDQRSLTTWSRHW